jgi:hypothetical protein
MDSIKTFGSAVKVPPKKAISPGRPEARTWSQWLVNPNWTERMISVA